MPEYDHGKRTDSEVWELSPLDLSIQQYEQRCKNYHYKKVKPADETEEQRKKRLTDLKEAKVHIDLECNRIMAMVSVEGQLQTYRTEFKHLKTSQKLKKYREEEHHPTDVLADNLRLAGRAQPSPRFTAHHLVEGKGKLPVTKIARTLVFRHDIRINDSDNGVWMPRTEKDRGHWAMPNATPHSRIHTHNYERWVYGQIQYLKSEQEIRHKLTVLRAHLKHGTEPKKIRMKSDKNWDGKSDS